MQCTFDPEIRFREEKGAFNAQILVILGKDGEAVRVQKGQTFEVRGVCDGFDETVRMNLCELLR